MKITAFEKGRPSVHFWLVDALQPNKSCTENRTGREDRIKAKVESGARENLRREVEEEAGSKSRDRHKVSHSLGDLSGWA